MPIPMQKEVGSPSAMQFSGEHFAIAPSRDAFLFVSTQTEGGESDCVLIKKNTILPTAASWMSPFFF